MAGPDECKAFFSQQIEENMDALYGVALRLAKHRANAEDLVAEAVVKGWAAFGSLADRERFRPWIFRILHNCFISQYRKWAARPVELSYSENPADSESPGLAELLNAQSDEFLSWWSEPEREFFNSLLGESLMEAIDCLPEAFRVTVTLINVEGLTYDEAAEVLGVPRGTIRSRMKRGRTLLQRALWDQARETGLVAAGARPEEGQ